MLNPDYFMETLLEGPRTVTQGRAGMGHERPNSQTGDHPDYVWPIWTRICVYVASDLAQFQPASCQDRYQSMSEPGQNLFQHSQA